ncbi:MAG: hypothetical protein MZU95_14635 [Desulfomicrobium escambiense]|nr:hypothetical protein [Desulfomicrobium escambiense]
MKTLLLTNAAGGINTSFSPGRADGRSTTTSTWSAPTRSSARTTSGSARASPT